jgi:hypothetical protein
VTGSKLYVRFCSSYIEVNPYSISEMNVFLVFSGHPLAVFDVSFTCRLVVLSEMMSSLVNI